RHIFINSIGGLVFVMAPLSALLILVGEDVVHILLGSQWSEAVPIFRIFAITMFVEPVLNSTTWVFVSLGRGDKLLTAALVSSPIIIVAFVVGLPWGASGVAWAYSLAVVVLVVPRLMHATRGAHIGILDFGRATIVQYTSALLALCAAFVLKEHVILNN